MKMYKFKFYDEVYNLIFTATTYKSNGTLAVQAMTEDGEPFATITVNILASDLCQPNCQYVDVNNVPGIADFLEKNKLAHPTGRMGCSGFCTYPEYEFDLNAIPLEL